MLTNEQVDELFSFCRKHYVQFYDVQLELVDHLANAIEEKMAGNKQLTFEAALNSVYAGFGIRGFADIVRTRTKLAQNRNRKMRRRIYLSYFTWPKAAMTACFISILCFFARFLTGEVFFYVLFVIAIGLWAYETIIFRQVRKMWQKQKPTLPLLMMGEGFDEPFLTFFLGLQILMPAFNHTDFFEGSANTHFLEYAVCSFTVVVMFVATLAYKEFAYKLNDMAREAYPEAFEVAA